MPRTLSVIGTGYLGAVHAACMAKLGHDVVALDTDASRVEALASGSAPFFEPGLDDLLNEVLAAGRLTFTTRYADVADADVHFICVGTPQRFGDNRAETSFLFSAADSLAPQLKTDSLVVGKSTVPVGTARVVASALRARARNSGVRLAWNPEFLREGFAIRDTLEPSRLVYGVEPVSRAQDVALLDEVYAKILSVGVPRVVTDLETAELVKAAANAFLATKISFINGIADMCEATGADVTQLAAAIGMDDRIGPKFLEAGLGYGGGCLPKDVRGLAARASELGASDYAQLLDQVDTINEHRRSKVLELARAYCAGDLAGKRIAVLGAAFKPGSDDIRDSPALEIALAAMRDGATVTVHDPRAIPSAQARFPELRYAGSVVEAVSQADVVLHLTHWPEYRQIDVAALSDVVRNKVMIDGRNSLPATWAEHGWTYVPIGRPVSLGALAAGDDLVSNA